MAPPQPEPNSTAATTSQAAAEHVAKRAKKKAGNRSAGAGQEEVALNASQSEFVRIIKVDSRKEAFSDDPQKVQLSKVGKAPQLQLSDDRLSVTGYKGFRTARASHGAHAGAWYCEVTIEHLGPTGHVRVGWCTKKAELQAPVGFDQFGYCYRDLEGSRVHQGKREAYGSAYGGGDVVGLALYLPEGGKPLESIDRTVVRYKGAIYAVDEAEPKPQPLQGSLLAFTLNGVPQGIAFSDILEGTYYPAASLYARPEQAEGARVRFNFGPDFAYPPPQLEGCPLPLRPACELTSLYEGVAAAQGGGEGGGAGPAEQQQQQQR